MVKLKLLAALAAATLFALPSGGTAAPSVERNPFPVVVQAENGRITIRKRPTRIVSLSPTATEMLFAVGAGRQVTAVDSLSNYPRRAPRTSLSGFRPNVEAVASYRPDVVVGDLDTDTVAELRKLGVTVLVYEAPAQLAGSYGQITQLGRATGHRAQAAAVVRSMRARITAAVAAAKKSGSQRLSVYHELTPDYYSATSRTFIGRIYGLFGLRNIADAAEGSGSGYPQLSGEYIVAANPQLIVLADGKCCGQSAATVSARPGWRSIAAVRTRSIVAIDDSVASRWGPRIVQLVRSVAAAVRRVPR
jgi:iron complex transport system substrate-binding protein